MPVGTSDGQYYESDLHQVFNMPVDPSGEVAGASKSKEATGVPDENKRTLEAPGRQKEAPTTSGENPLYEFNDEGKKYHFRYTPDEFQKQFGKDPIHNDWDEMFRFKNGDYGIHIAPPAPPPKDDPTPVGIKGDFDRERLDRQRADEPDDEYENRLYSEMMKNLHPLLKEAPPSKNIENRRGMELWPQQDDPKTVQKRSDEFWARGEQLSKTTSTDKMAIEAGINNIPFSSGKQTQAAGAYKKPKKKDLGY